MFYFYIMLKEYFLTCINTVINSIHHPLHPRLPPPPPPPFVHHSANIAILTKNIEHKGCVKGKASEIKLTGTFALLEPKGA